MNIGYTKLFNTIIASTIWNESNETRIVWITMLALADRDGIVSASVPGLATLARIAVEPCRGALTFLESPDKDSRTPDHEGRRIEKIDGGWKILNHGKYRAMMDHESRKEYKRLKESERRLNQKRGQSVDKYGQTWTNVTHTETDTETKAGKEGEAPPTMEEIPAMAEKSMAGLKKKVRPPHPLKFELLKIWVAEYPLSHEGHAYHCVEGRDDKVIDNLLEKFSPVQIMERAHLGWKSPKQFIFEKSSTFSGLYQFWNDIGNDGKAKSKTNTPNI